MKKSELRLIIREAVAKKLQSATSRVAKKTVSKVARTTNKPKDIETKKRVNEAKVSYEYITRTNPTNEKQIQAVVKYGTNEKVLGNFTDDERGRKGAQLKLDNFKASRIEKQIDATKPEKVTNPFDESVKKEKVLEEKIRKIIRSQILEIRSKKKSKLRESIDIDKLNFSAFKQAMSKRRKDPENYEYHDAVNDAINKLAKQYCPGCEEQNYMENEYFSGEYSIQEALEALKEILEDLNNE